MTNSSIPFMVLPAAGLGTRMRPVDAHVPKEMLPLGSKPVIQYALEEAADASVSSVVLVISPQKEALRSHVEGLDLSCSVEFVYQDQPTGEADALRLAGEIVGRNAAAIVYPDNVYLPAPGAVRQLAAVSEQTGKSVMALEAFADHETRASGGVDLTQVGERLYRIDCIRSKGASSVPSQDHGLRGCGFSVVRGRFFEYLASADSRAPDGEQGDHAVYARLVEEDGLMGVRLPGRVFDAGEPAGYDDCVSALAGR